MNSEAQERSGVMSAIDSILLSAAVFPTVFFSTLVVAEVVDTKVVPSIIGPLSIIEERTSTHVTVQAMQPDLSVYFDNGRAVLLGPQRQHFDHIKKAFTACGPLTIRVAGSASSVSFKDDRDDSKNIALANSRAEFVSRRLRIGTENIAVEKVDVEKLVRKYLDLRKDAKSNPIEYLNRRVDISIVNGECKQITQFQPTDVLTTSVTAPASAAMMGHRPRPE